MADLKIRMEEEGGQNKMEFSSNPKKSGKPKKKHAKRSDEPEDLGAVPPHIMRIMQTVEAKKKMRTRNEGQQAPDSVSIFKNMMAQVRTKASLDEAGEEVRQDKENDIRMITNARDIFKNLEGGEEQNPQPTVEKHKRVEVNPNFLLSGQNKAEEMRRARLKEMAAMRNAREQTLDEEAAWNREQKQKADDIKRQREMELEMMKMARQQAIEEEERLEQLTRTEYKRQVSPGLEAAKNVSFQNRDPYAEGANKIERMRQEREREIMEMKRAREMMMEEEEVERHDGRSEASRELEAFRASRQAGGIKDRFQPVDEERDRQEVTRAPKARVRSDNWMSNSSHEKQEEARMQRAREIEMMMVARSQAIEEEEIERAEEERQRRMEAESKAREMAILVADLQRMRAETANSVEDEEMMTRYQEEMMQRVMELHEIQRGGLVNN